MTTESLEKAVKGLTLDDIRIDSLGRVVIAAPTVSDQIKAIGTLRPDMLARDDTNVICCGNTTCCKKGVQGMDLPSLMERVVGTGKP